MASSDSDSEEDFLSADEGSDSDIQSKIPTLTHSNIQSETKEKLFNHSCESSIKYDINSDDCTASRTEAIAEQAAYPILSTRCEKSCSEKSTNNRANINIAVEENTPQTKDSANELVIVKVNILDELLELSDFKRNKIVTENLSSKDCSSFSGKRTKENLFADKKCISADLINTEDETSRSKENICKDQDVYKRDVPVEVQQISRKAAPEGKGLHETELSGNTQPVALHTKESSSGEIFTSVDPTSTVDTNAKESLKHLSGTLVTDVTSTTASDILPDSTTRETLKMTKKIEDISISSEKSSKQVAVSETTASNVTFSRKVSSIEESEKSELNKDIKDSSAFVGKPRKTSRIGLKKPREKLGERLGSRKLGSGKPLEGISCDSLIQAKPQQDVNVTAATKQLKKEDSWEKIEPEDFTSQPYSETGGSSSRAADDSSWGYSWGGWGSSLISAASTLTQEVGRGVGSVVELVEGGMGVPSPEQLAREQAERERAQQQWEQDWQQEHASTEAAQKQSAEAGSEGRAEKQSSAGGSSSSSSTAAPVASGFRGIGFGGFSSLVSGVSEALETAGSKVVMGGLDTLELIGRRTMDVLQDTDPNLRHKKESIVSRIKKPNLSAVLREAREFAVANPVSSSSSDESMCQKAAASRISFLALWENSAGPAHLEALALIARQCSASTADIVDTLPQQDRRALEDRNMRLMELSEIDEDNLSESCVFAEKVAGTIRELRLPLNADNIAQCWSDLSIISTQYKKGSASLAEAVAGDARTVESNLIGGCVSLVERLVAVAHKLAEICLTSSHDKHDPVRLASNYRELVVLGSSQLESCADTVCTGLSSTPQQEQLTLLITNIYMQVCEGSSCLQQSLVHLCTTLQLVQAQQALA